MDYPDYCCHHFPALASILNYPRGIQKAKMKTPRHDKKGRIYWKEDYLGKGIIIITGMAVIILSGWISYISTHPKIIEAPYVVYRPEHKIVESLNECQEDWREDQITKKLLRLKIKRLEGE